MCILASKFIYKPLAKTEFADFFYKHPYYMNEPERTIKLYFSAIYEDGYFIEAIYSTLVEYDGFSTEGNFWYYPDMNSPYPSDRFEGVCFANGSLECAFYVSERESFEHAKKACERFWELHPDHKEFLSEIINNWKPLNPEQ